ncbi:DUF7576 family protein [Halomicrobium urmianum]|uniref:DUF7576 family protein n=1 Tax=Halomicrobium urmianum TaxID=1586233 RepID=UPI001CD9F99A|nr:hypothetical protein [Halomicrobium urmianum]
MVDPTSDLQADVDEEGAPTCETCGDAIANDPNHRVSTWVEDGSVRTVHFCDDACRQSLDRE